MYNKNKIKQRNNNKIKIDNFYLMIVVKKWFIKINTIH